MSSFDTYVEKISTVLSPFLPDIAYRPSYSSSTQIKGRTVIGKGIFYSNTNPAIDTHVGCYFYAIDDLDKEIEGEDYVINLHAQCSRAGVPIDFKCVINQDGFPAYVYFRQGFVCRVLYENVMCEFNLSNLDIYPLVPAFVEITQYVNKEYTFTHPQTKTYKSLEEKLGII